MITILMCLNYKIFFLLLVIVRVQMLNTLERDREIVELEQKTCREKKAERQRDKHKSGDGKKVTGDTVATPYTGTSRLEPCAVT